MQSSQYCMLHWHSGVRDCLKNCHQNIQTHTFQFSDPHQEPPEVGTGRLWTQCSEAKGQHSEEWQRRLAQTPAQYANSNDITHTAGHKPPKFTNRIKCHHRELVRCPAGPYRTFANSLPSWRLVTINIRPDVTALG